MPSPARTALAASAALVLALGLSIEIAPTGPAAGLPVLTAGKAEAGPVHRTARRTARRTTRRQAYIATLPRGCVWRAPYHYCGGVYYATRVVDGRDVYVVVNP